MTQQFAANRGQLRASNALVFGVVLLFAPAIPANKASAQLLGYAPAPQSSFSSDRVPAPPAQTEEGDGRASAVPERLRREVVSFDTREAPGTIIIDTGNTALYYVLGQGRAIRYGVGVGREGFTWAGVQTISRKTEWPDWYPPTEMIARQPYLPRFIAGGPGNPLGARAIYLGSSQYRIHGTNDPSTIGKFVSSGCIRMTNEDVADLSSRANVGSKVVVLPKKARHLEARALEAGGTITVRPMPAQSRPATILSSGRQAMNISTSSLY